MADKYARFTLPMPPSVNALWRNSPGNTHRSSKYKSWRTTAGKELQVLSAPKIEPPYKVEYLFGRPDKTRRDVFNFEKALSDLLETHGIITDDCHILWGCVAWSADVSPGRVQCTIEHIEVPA